MVVAIDRLCRHCGAKFEARAEHQRFCSTAHRVAYHNRLKRPGVLASQLASLEDRIEALEAMRDEVAV